MSSSCTVVVLAYNRPDLLFPLVDSIVANTPPPYDLLVVDNGSDDGIEQKLLHHGVNVLGIYPNVGFSNANNLAVGSIDTEYACLLNEDMLAHPGWLEPLLEAMEDPTVGIAGSKLVYGDGRIQHAGINFYAEQGRVLYGEHELEDLPTRDVKGVTAACMMVRRDEFLDLGGFDPRYRQGNEDCDLNLKYLDAGFRIRYVRESVLTHYESQSGPSRWAHTPDNVRRFTARWLDRPDLWQA